MIMFMILAIMALSLVGINSPKCPKCKVPKLYVKLMGLRYAGAELMPDEKLKYRLQMATHAVVQDTDVKALLTPHTKILLHYMRCL